MKKLLLTAGFSLLAFWQMTPDASLFAQEKKTREQKVREDRAKVEAEGFWLYNDIPGAMREAQKSGKPVLVVLRCLPCEECVKLDDDLVDQDPVLQSLLKQFVCVRVVGTNGLDLNTFQYDTDQSFAVFMLNADGTIYGRFGTRSHRSDWVGDVSLQGMAKALSGALELHASYPANKSQLAGKKGPAPLFSSPEKYPSLREKYEAKINYEGDVVRSCIHCHQIGDAERDYYRAMQQPIPENILYPYPHPKSVGIVLDPKERATIVEVTAGSPAARAGLQKGDAITTMQGQPLLSMADVQWVLHQVPPAGGVVPLKVQRGGKELELSLKLDAGWRKAGDISWRVSTWGLRRMATGGLVLEDTSSEARQQAGVSANQMALKVKHVGQYGEHAAAKNAGFREGDILVKVDGRTDLFTETALIEYGVTQRKAGDKLAVTVQRNGKPVQLQLPLQR